MSIIITSGEGYKTKTINGISVYSCQSMKEVLEQIKQGCSYIDNIHLYTKLIEKIYNKQPLEHDKYCLYHEIENYAKNKNYTYEYNNDYTIEKINGNELYRYNSYNGENIFRKSFGYYIDNLDEYMQFLENFYNNKLKIKASFGVCSSIIKDLSN